MIHIFPSGPISTNAYLFYCPGTLKCVVVDPAPGSFDELKHTISSKQLTPIYLLLTHSHWDHIGDAAKVKEEWDLPVLVHPSDKENVERPGSDQIPCWVSVPPTKVDGLLNDGQEIEVGEERLLVIHTPGHSPGSVCFYCPKRAILLSGDTLFQGSIGILSLPGGDPEAMWASLDRLSELPPEVDVYPGHGEPTTIGKEEWLPKAKELFA